MNRRISRLLDELLPGQRLRQRVAEARPRLYRIAWSWCHDAALADDLVQETLTRALGALDELRDPRRLDVWLTRILVNVFRDQQRRTTPATGWEGELASEADAPDQAVLRQDLVTRTRAAIARLNDDQRKVLTLVDLADFSYADAARALDVPVGTVMSRLARARQRLRELLNADLAPGAEQRRVIPLRKR
jgi:RNA polymerase sigma-70 factor (ECF subfamily)